ncbi:MAG: tRNA (adenosine(37)-N6)-threonylcarbamoyltransferase complex ATPase subunit type 1 TsaE [Pseudomonadota bacterium]
MPDQPTCKTAPPCRSGDRHHIFLADHEATARLGHELSKVLSAGDIVLLDGEMGTGKTALARALIAARLRADGKPPEDIPSPTFTLVQTYEADVPIWHSDLYRLTDPDEAAELGLEEAFEGAITLIEWPDRLGRMIPPRWLRLTLGFAVPEGRWLRWAVSGSGWEDAEAVLEGMDRDC